MMIKLQERVVVSKICMVNWCNFMRILLIEDSVRLRRSLSDGLKKAGYVTDMTGDGSEGLWLAESHDYDVIILDLMLPGMDGLTLLTKLRQKQNGVHVLILSARDTVDDRVMGLSKGADDYMVKPFAFEELLARVQALVRRRYGVKQNQITIGDLIIDLDKKTVFCMNTEIELPPREYALLELLALRKGSVVSRQEIEEHIYDEHVEPASNVVDAAICSLRKRFDQAGQAPLIKTKRGQGYLID